MQNGLIPNPQVVVDHWEGTSAAEVSLKSEGSQSHTGFPSPGVQYQKEESPQHLAIKIIKNFIHRGEKVAVNPDVLLKVPCTDSLACKH